MATDNPEQWLWELEVGTITKTDGDKTVLYLDTNTQSQILTRIEQEKAKARLVQAEASLDKFKLLTDDKDFIKFLYAQIDAWQYEVESFQAPNTSKEG